MILKKVLRKDRQLQSQSKQSDLIWSKANPEYIAFFKQVKQNMIRASKQTCIEQLTVIDLTQRNQNIKLQTQRYIDSFIQVFIQQISSQPASVEQLSRQDKELMIYFAKIMVLTKTTSLQDNIWKWRELLVLGLALLKKIEQFKGKPELNDVRLQQTLIFNSAVCYTELHMYIEALSCLDRIQKMEIYHNQPILTRVDNLKKLVLIKMGRPCKHISNKITPTKIKSETDNQQFERRLERSKEFLMLLSLSKSQLLSFLQNNLNHYNICIQNAYNLALLCKNHRLYVQATIILSSLLSEAQVLSNDRLTKRCLALMGLIKEQQKQYDQAIKYLEIIKTSGAEEKKEIEFHIWQLKKKSKLEKAISSCPTYSAKTSRKYQLLQSLHDDLDKLTKKTCGAILQKQRKLTSTIYRPKNKKKYPNSTPSQLSLKKVSSNLIPNIISTISRRQSFQKLPQPQINKKKSQVQSLRKRIEQRSSKDQQINKGSVIEGKGSIQEERRQKLKKTVKFKLQEAEQPRQQAIDMIYKYEEKIMGAVLQQKKLEAMSYIQQAFEKTLKCQSEIPPWSLANFKIKCINWCKKVQSKEQAARLLQQQIGKIVQSSPIKIKFMKELAKTYEEMFEYKKAVKINLELADLGEVDYLDKSAELCLAKHNYSEAAQYYEHYYQRKPTTYALVKLAHAYSKICTHTKIAIEILNDLLFQSRNTCLFKRFDPSQTEHIQNAVILLATIHISMNGVKRAQEICEQYLKINFSAYPVYYLLGMIHNQNGNQKEAFNYFINSLKLKPNHLPSLMEIVKYIGLAHSNTSQIIGLLRRAFIYNHRNWELLQLLIQAITGTRKDNHPISIKRLIEYARILEEMGGASDDFWLEAELVWMWALEYIEQKKQYLPCFDQEYSTICIRLGQINLKKGNYEASQLFFKKILVKLHDGRLQPSRHQPDNVRLELQLLDRMVYIKLQQQKQTEAFDLLNQSQSLAKTNSLQIWAAEISHKIANLKQLFETQ